MITVHNFSYYCKISYRQSTALNLSPMTRQENVKRDVVMYTHCIWLRCSSLMTLSGFQCPLEMFYKWSVCSFKNVWARLVRLHMYCLTTENRIICKWEQLHLNLSASKQSMGKYREDETEWSFNSPSPSLAFLHLSLPLTNYIPIFKIIPFKVRLKLKHKVCLQKSK